jgi:HAMP domain-containing protein
MSVAPVAFRDPAFIPRSGIDHVERFMSVDALALHLLRQRPGRRLELCPGVCFQGVPGDQGFPVVTVFAMRGRERMERRLDGIRQGDPEAEPLTEEWLGWAAGYRANQVEELEAALNRMRSAGGLAA